MVDLVSYHVLLPYIAFYSYFLVTIFCSFDHQFWEVPNFQQPATSIVRLPDHHRNTVQHEQLQGLLASWSIISMHNRTSLGIAVQCIEELNVSTNSFPLFPHKRAFRN